MTNKKHYYHGTDYTLKDFNDKLPYLAVGHALEGPGIYFTSDIDDAARYGKYIYEVTFKFRNFVPTTGKVKINELKKLLNAAPDLNESLQNWSENRSQAYRMVVNQLKILTPHEAFQSIWYDFYRYEENKFVNNLIAMKYDAVLTPRQNNVTHIIAYNPQCIEIIGMIDKSTQ